MILQDQIAEIADSQIELFLNKPAGIKREMLASVPDMDNFATIITGIRRCGKSTLLLQLLKEKQDNAFYFNWEDIRLSAFDTDDFKRLYNDIIRRNVRILFFDEIQLVKGWEVFVHQLLREGFRVFVTGSNASLLSREMGTHLTGRHFSIELFPFSFAEFCSFKNIQQDINALDMYVKTGGIPDYVKTEQGFVLQQLTDDILMRDIVVRYGIRDVDALRQLTVFLLSNVGNLTSANKLTGLFGTKSAATILEYFSYLTNSYLVEFVPQFDYSLKAQSRNPKKIYAIDTGLVTEVSNTFSENTGHVFENLIYLHLRREKNEIFYFKKDGECDFVVKEREKITRAIQVCYELNDENFDREAKGILAAMNFFGLNEGFVVTKNQDDVFQKDGKMIKVVSAVNFLKNN
ncbi:MAG: ATP-binding protein [Petrimonas sp.]|nr:ATP-binding protein [Petrimonas sp.]